MIKNNHKQPKNKKCNHNFIPKRNDEFDGYNILDGYTCVKCEIEISVEEYNNILKTEQNLILKKHKIYALLQFFSALILLGITGYYALQTQNMAQTMEEGYKVDTKPLITILSSIESGPGGNLRFFLSNVGKVPSQFEVEYVTLNGSSILPKETFYPVLYPQIDPMKFGTIAPENEVKKGDRLEIKIIFWNPEKSDKKYYLKRFVELREDGWYLSSDDEFGEE